MSKVLVLRCCNPDMTSYGGFQWPCSGPVSCPDWDSAPICGKGLHGWLWGVGDLDVSEISRRADAVWLVVEVEGSEIVNLNRKVKFPRGNVVFCGTREAAGTYIAVNGGLGTPVMFASLKADHYAGLVVGDHGSAEVGVHGVAVSGEKGKSKAKSFGVSVAGDTGAAESGNQGVSVARLRGEAVSGHCGLSVAGDHGTAKAGGCGQAFTLFRGTSVVERDGHAHAGDEGFASAGAYGRAVAGRRGAATVGPGGVAHVLRRGRARAGVGGTLLIEYVDNRSQLRVAVGYAGEGGIEPDVYYRVNSGGEFYEAEDQE